MAVRVVDRGLPLGQGQAAKETTEAQAASQQVATVVAAVQVLLAHRPQRQQARMAGRVHQTHTREPLSRGQAVEEEAAGIQVQRVPVVLAVAVVLAQGLRLVLLAPPIQAVAVVLEAGRPQTRAQAALVGPVS